MDDTSKASGAAHFELWYRVAIAALSIAAAALAIAVVIRLSCRLLRAAGTGGHGEPASVEVSTVPGVPLAGSGRWQGALRLLLRFVLLELGLRLWQLVPAAFNLLDDTIPYAVSAVASGESMAETDSTRLPAVVTVVLPRIVSFGFVSVYWTILIAFGWPLLRDTCRHLGVSLKGLFAMPGSSPPGRDGGDDAQGRAP